MDTKFKIILIVCVVCILVVMGYVIKKQYDTINSLQETAQGQRYLQDQITAVQATMLSQKSFDEKLTQLNMDMSVIKKDLEKTNASITSIIVATNTTPGGINNNVPSTGTLPRDNNNPTTITPPEQANAPPANNICDNKTCFPDQYGYFARIPYLRLNEPLKDSSGIPIGDVTFDVKKPNPWGYNIFGRQYTTSVVIATNPSGKKTAYAKMSIKPNDGSNKTYDLPETQIQFYERLPSAQLYWWNPSVLFSLNAGATQNLKFAFGPSLQAFISSYGVYKNRADWYIGGVGINYDINNSVYNFALTPFMYKITGDDSIFQNINIGPTIAIDVHGTMSVFGGIGLRL